MKIVIVLKVKTEKSVDTGAIKISERVSNTFCEFTGTKQEMAKLLEAEMIINSLTTARCHISVDEELPYAHGPEGNCDMLCVEESLKSKQ